MKLSELEKYLNTAIQLRTAHADKVVEYAEKMKEGVKFPAITIGHWPKTDKYGERGIVDGMTRYAAAVKAGLTELDVETKKFNTLAEALTFGYEANKAHGLPVTEGQRNKRIQLLRQTDPSMNIDKLAKIFNIGRSSIDRILKGEQGEGAPGFKKGAQNKQKKLSEPMAAKTLYKTIVKLNNEFVRKRPQQLVELAAYCSPISEEAPEGAPNGEMLAELDACSAHLLAVCKLANEK